MKASTLKYGVLTLTLSLLTIVIALLPFHAFLTVWLSSFFGNYTSLRLWKEVLVLIAALGVLYLVLFDSKVRSHTLKRKLTWLIIAYLAVQLVWAGLALHDGDVSLKAAAYGVLLNSRFLIFFLLAWAIAIRTDRLERRWPKLLLWPAVIVVVFGLMQVFVLPSDFLRHFGYGPETIYPVSTINHNEDYQRYFSTLRGVNPLGAYLLIPISALVVLLVRYPRSWNWTKGLLLAGAMAMLVFTFSRSAWLGVVASLVVIAFGISTKSWWYRLRWPLASVATALVLGLGLAAYGLRNHADFQNFIFHTEDDSTIEVSSNDARADAIISGAKDIAQHPIGKGPGTAGPASVYNTEEPGRIAENYYLQVGQETGVIGLGLFLAISGIVAWLLWVRRRTPLALALLAAFVGIAIVNLMQHAWTDDTLAYIWWGLAGLAIGTPVAKKLHDETADIKTGS